MLSRAGAIDSGTGCKNEGEAMAWEAIGIRGDGENERSREGEKER